MSGWVGQKAGYCILWQGEKRVGDNFVPETYELEVEFNLPDYKTGVHCYLQMMTYDVNDKYNYVYVNGNKIQSLTPQGKSWGLDAIFIDAHANNLKKGTNKLKITARNNVGGIGGNIDDFRVRDPIIIYAIE